MPESNLDSNAWEGGLHIRRQCCPSEVTSDLKEHVTNMRVSNRYLERKSNQYTKAVFSFSISLLFSIIVNVVCTSDASAAPLVVTKDAKGATQISTRVRTDAIGVLKVPNGSVKIQGDVVSVSAIPDWLFDRHVVLTGKLLNHRIEPSTQGSTSVSISGLIYFLNGDWINSLPDQRVRDSVTMNDGSIQSGRLRSINEDTVDFQIVTGQVRQLKISEIGSIDSPRAFSFTWPVQNYKEDSNTTATADVANITLDPTIGKNGKRFIAKKKPEEPHSTLSGTEGGVSKRQIAGMITMDALNTMAPMIVAPLVAPMGANGAKKQLRHFGLREQQGLPQY